MRLEQALDRRLTDAISGLHRVGTVSGTTGTRVLVTVDGASMTLPRLASYSPTVGDVVQILAIPGRWLVLGRAA